MNKKVIISGQRDEVIGANYDLVLFNAKELSAHLKSSLKKSGVDYNQFNSEYDCNKKREGLYGEELEEVQLQKSPPKEIYEYQNFFLLEKEGGELVLLDGFRRLLWYNSPDANIFVRIYKKSDLKDDQILTLLVYLNHFKFFGGGNYQERGFGLLLHTVFGLNTNKYSEAFDGYLTKEEMEKDYGYDSCTSIEKNERVKSRIINPMFVSDIRFLKELNDAGCMMKRFTGALVFQKRQETDKDFSSTDFIARTKANSSLQGLMVKLNKKDYDRNYINQIMEIYINIFSAMMGKKAGKSYAEELDECRALSKEISKDKDWFKLTGYRGGFADEVMEQMIKDGKADQLKFKCVIFPSEGKHKKDYFECGLNEEVKFLRMGKGEGYLAGEKMIFGIKRGKEEFIVGRTFMGNTEYKSLRARNYDYISPEIDLFANISRAEVEKRKQEWHAENKRNSDRYHAGLAEAEAERNLKSKIKNNKTT